MLWSLATKVGALAGRCGAFSGPGKVACAGGLVWMQRGEEGVLEGCSGHATAYCSGHVDPSAYLFCTTFLSLLWGQGAAQDVHAHAHPYTPPGKGRGLRGALLSTHETGTGTGSGKGTAMVISVGLQIVVGVLGVASFTAVAVHHLDQREIMRVEGERAAEIKLAAAEIKRVPQSGQKSGSFDTP